MREMVQMISAAGVVLCLLSHSPCCVLGDRQEKSDFLCVGFIPAGSRMSGIDGESDIFYGEDINPPRPTADFVLFDQNGEPVAFNDYLGDVVVVAFLFTRCPDVCPQVGANMAWIGEALGEDLGEEVHLLSITVDPWYDNSSVLWNYAYDRGLEWPHLSSELEIMEPVWRSFEVGLETYANDSDGDGTVDGFDLCPDTPRARRLTPMGAAWRPSSRRMRSKPCTTPCITSITPQAP